MVRQWGVCGDKNSSSDIKFKIFFKYFLNIYFSNNYLKYITSERNPIQLFQVEIILAICKFIYRIEKSQSAMYENQA